MDDRQISLLTRRLISTGSPMEHHAGYSRAVVQGDWCFVSGTCGWDYPDLTLPDGVEAQTRNTLTTIRRTLDEAGFSMANIVRCQYTVTDRSHIDEIFSILGETFGDIRPAATMVIAGLMDERLLVEIEVTAFRG